MYARRRARARSSGGHGSRTRSGWQGSGRRGSGHGSGGSGSRRRGHLESRRGRNGISIITNGRGKGLLKDELVWAWSTRMTTMEPLDELVRGSGKVGERDPGAFFNRKLLPLYVVLIAVPNLVAVEDGFNK